MYNDDVKGSPTYNFPMTLKHGSPDNGIPQPVTGNRRVAPLPVCGLPYSYTGAGSGS